MDETVSNLESVVALAAKLSPVDKVRLLERVATVLEGELATDIAAPRRSLYGICRDLGVGPSNEDMSEIRAEMWKDFPREDMVE